MSTSLKERESILGAWRARLSWQSARDARVAEAAIHRVYEAAGLAPPRTVLWARGPREAASAVSFLLHPRRATVRRTAVSGMLAALYWIVLALAAHPGLPPAPEVLPRSDSPLVAVALAGILMAIAFGHMIPLPPLRRRRGFDWVVLCLALAVFMTAIANAFLFLGVAHGTTAPYPPAVWLAMAGAVGVLPGIVDYLRLRRAFRDVDPVLRDLPRQTGVMADLARARLSAMRGVRIDGKPLGAAAATPPYSQLENLSLARTCRHAFTAAGVESASLDGITDAPQAALVHVLRLGNPDAAQGPLGAFADLSFAVDRLYPFDRAAVAVEPPVSAHFDPEGRPHSADGPALEWGDGVRVYCWHGTIVPGSVIKSDTPLTLARIRREPNPELRRIMIERYGAGRYMLEAGAVEVQRDRCGILYRLRQDDDEPIVMVRVLNSTREPDGSIKEFWLRVPPTLTTAHEAVAWTFGLTPATYRPEAET